MNDKQLAQKYIEHMHNLLIYEREADITEIHQQLKEKESRIKELEERIQTKNIAQEIVNNPQFRTEVMKLLHPIAKEAFKEIEKQGKQL
ncbi:hypothetical protein ES703_116153 [subsurface metagenome]